LTICVTDHLALGDLAPLSVDGDEHRLVERREQKCGQGFLGPTAGVAGLALLAAGVQWRLAVVVRVFALRLGHLVSLASSAPMLRMPIAARGRQPWLRYADRGILLGSA
jgi:hypothetical protein